MVTFYPTFKAIRTWSDIRRCGGAEVVARGNIDASQLILRASVERHHFSHFSGFLGVDCLAARPPLLSGVVRWHGRRLWTAPLQFTSRSCGRSPMSAPIRGSRNSLPPSALVTRWRAGGSAAVAWDGYWTSPSGSGNPHAHSDCLTWSRKVMLRWCGPSSVLKAARPQSSSANSQSRSRAGSRWWSNIPTYWSKWRAAPPNQVLHLTAAAHSVFGVQGLTGRRGR
jgi:hypothetical protein